jgi:hypothetical protein
LLCVVVASAVQDEEIDGGVKRAFLSSPSGWGFGSRFGDESQDSARSSSFKPHRTRQGGSICYPAHNGVPMATDSDNISIRSIKEMEKYESLHQREFAHTRVYDVNFLERVGMDEELSLILWTIGWEKFTEGIGQLERWMDDFATVQTEMQASIDSNQHDARPLQSLRELTLMGEMPGAQV